MSVRYEYLSAGEVVASGEVETEADVPLPPPRTQCWLRVCRVESADWSDWPA